MAAQNLGRPKMFPLVIEANDLSELSPETLHLVGELGRSATLVQISSGFCAPCRSARVVLGRAAAADDDVRHIEIDLAHHPEQSRLLGVTNVPTTFVLDTAGAVLARFAGVPQFDAVQSLLARVT